MTTDAFSVLKQSRIDEVSRLAATEFGASDWIAGFVSHYFRNVTSKDLFQRSTDDLFQLVKTHYLAGRQRGGAESDAIKLAIYLPYRPSHGWEAGGSTVIQLVMPDSPYIVDSLMLELERQDWAIRDVVHPQFAVHRDRRGVLTSADPLSSGDSEAAPESWVHIEAYPPLGTAAADAIPRLEAGLWEAMLQVRRAVTDFRAMKNRMVEIAAEMPNAPMETAERERAQTLLSWLADDHFTFLGAATFDFAPAGPRMDPNSVLGILADKSRADGFCAQPTEPPHDLVVLTKDTEVSHVQHGGYVDYIGVRRFDSEGRIIGEHRFLGLLSSAAYDEAIDAVPVLREKAQQLLERTGLRRGSHGAKKMRGVIERFPRDELLQASVDELYPVIREISQLRERRQVRLFLRAGEWGRFLSCLVYLPRERFNTQTRLRIQEILQRELGAESFDYRVQITESVLARLFFVFKLPEDAPIPVVDIPALERELTDAGRHWEDEFVDCATGLASEQRGVEFPDAYQEDYTAQQGYWDLLELNSLTAEHNTSVTMFTSHDPDDAAPIRLKIFRTGERIELTSVIPHLTYLGTNVLDERPYEINLRGERAMIYDFGLEWPEDTDHHHEEESQQRFIEAFEASFEGKAEADALNALVLTAGLTWVEVSWLRAISRYLRQAGVAYSQEYLAQALCANPVIAAKLVEYFRSRFEPPQTGGVGKSKAEQAAVTTALAEAIDQVESLDHDRILRAFMAVISASVRTNAFTHDARAFGLKLEPDKLELLPEPRPSKEIFVCSPRVEGVHLRFGAVARGGLRWSDRAEDFRTEILGLVKAQLVKNTVIVPAGAKGGFYAKQLPTDSDRAAWMAEGVECYRIFVDTLLSLTDNIVNDVVLCPDNVVRYDDDDPYLVVAADKGTATFSDIANSISSERGFWLGDAFASGGSIGYDHKAMGITAKGAWMATLRHFHEMGIDPDTDEFTCVGIGDMSGDVFGNGMLLSDKMRLVAAFNHMHVFLDPDPDPAVSFAERKRLFELPRSTWADYDPSCLSDGGGIFARSAKSIQLTPQVRERLGIDDSITTMSPTELISAILAAPVDLLWNGGIGTYVKGTNETQADVGDKAGDALRINGSQVRAKCVVEGGNLGLTQAGRIEYAQSGGRVNTDFIDNSAGVDTSDHEVNIKILLDARVAAGQLTVAERNELLPQMADSVAELVLHHNVDQNRALANEMMIAKSYAGLHQDWMNVLTEAGYLNRELEKLPSVVEMDERIEHGGSLTNPELCSLLAWTKIFLADAVLASDLPEDSYLADRMIHYFPALISERFASSLDTHRLRREIITTVAVNRFVNSSGITIYHRLSSETGADVSDVFRAQLAARSLFEIASWEAMTHNSKLSADVQTSVRRELQRLVERGARWILYNLPMPIDIAQQVESFSDGVSEIAGQLPGLLTETGTARYERRLANWTEKGLPEPLARVLAGASFAYFSLSMVHISHESGRDLQTVAQTYFAVIDQLGLESLLEKIEMLGRKNRWETMARSAVREELLARQAQLTNKVLDAGSRAATPSERIAAWLETVPGAESKLALISEVGASEPDLARLSVGLRTVSSLLGPAQ